MSNTHRLSRDSYLSLGGNNLNYYEITGRGSGNEDSASKENFSEWKDNAIDAGNYKVIPFGNSNDIPKQIQETVLPNSFANRSLKRKVELLIEQGPYLYEQQLDGTQYYRKPVENEPIQEFLESINHEELLHANALDYYFQEALFNKVYRAKGGRLSSSTPAAVEHISAFNCRLAYRKGARTKKATHVLVGDWNNSINNSFDVYPLYNAKDPGKYPVAINYVKMSSYGVEDYPLPDIYGSLDWIKNTTNTPKIFNAFIENSLNIKWHIQSPSKYWDEKREILRTNCKSSKIEYKEQMLEDLKTEILDSLSNLLSGVENVGKFWHNEYVITLIGANAVELGWKITPIEQKTKEWVESQIKMYDTAKFAMQASLGVHASLLMVGADGKSDSGSEQLNAYVIHQKTATSIPEYYVCKPLNDMIKAIFNVKTKIGFYRTTPERQQDVSNKDRLIPTTEPKTPQE